MLRIIVCGSRTSHNRAQVWDELDRILTAHPELAVIQGGAEGVDRLARRWCDARAVTCITVPPNWQKHGRAAGPMRNIEMLSWVPHEVVAFPGNEGTADMVRRAKNAAVPVRHIEWERKAAA